MHAHGTEPAARASAGRVASRSAHTRLAASMGPRPRTRPKGYCCKPRSTIDAPHRVRCESGHSCHAIGRSWDTRSAHANAHAGSHVKCKQQMKENVQCRASGQARTFAREAGPIGVGASWARLAGGRALDAEKTLWAWDALHLPFQALKGAWSTFCALRRSIGGCNSAR